MNMKVVRRVLVTLAFVLLTRLIITAASTYYDLLFLFYPSFCRELLGYLAEKAAGFDYMVWQKLLFWAAIAAVVFLLARLVLRKNILVWLFSITAIASFVVCVSTLILGANQYGPSIAEPLRLETANYSVAELQEAAEYYRDQANLYANLTARDRNNLCIMPSFEELANQVNNGFHTMTRTCYVFGGSTVAPKPLEWPKVLKRFHITSLMVSLTGEAGVNPDILPAALPFTMDRTVAQRMSIAREDDASFASILACLASESTEYQYSGYFIAYQYCYNALLEQNPAVAKSVNEGANAAVRADLLANQPIDKDADDSDLQYLPVPAISADSSAKNNIYDLLVAWYVHLTTPDEEDTDTQYVRTPTTAGSTSNRGKTSP